LEAAPAAVAAIAAAAYAPDAAAGANRRGSSGSEIFLNLTRAESWFQSQQLVPIQQPRFRVARLVVFRYNFRQSQQLLWRPCHDEGATLVDVGVGQAQRAVQLRVQLDTAPQQPAFQAAGRGVIASAADTGIARGGAGDDGCTMSNGIGRVVGDGGARGRGAVTYI